VNRPCYSAKPKRFGLSSLEAESAFASLIVTEPMAPASHTFRRNAAASRRSLKGSVLAQAAELPLERTNVSRSPFSSKS
jgi:hypothetical protein